MRPTRGFRAAFPLLVALLASTRLAAGGSAAIAASIEVTLSPSVAKSAVDGRVILALSKDEADEPRMQVAAGVNAIQVFGVDVDGLAPGGGGGRRRRGLRLSGREPRRPAGGALLACRRCSTTTRPSSAPTGTSVKLPDGPRRGPALEPRAGQLAVARRARMRLDPAARRARSGCTLDQAHPADRAARRTRQYVKHVRIQSKLLIGVLGPADAPRRARAAARRLRRRTPRRATR